RRAGLSALRAAAQRRAEDRCAGLLRRDQQGQGHRYRGRQGPLAPARYGISTAAPVNSPLRKCSSASLAADSGMWLTLVLTESFGASAKNSHASARVRLAT